MSALPILVDWGNVISKLVVAGLAGGAVLAYRAIRNRRDVKPAREDAARMSLSLDEPREGPIAIRGIYRGDAIECAGQHVPLVGAVDIVRGSRATWKRGVREYTLCDGDTVLAIGRMTRRTTDASYRESAAAWQLVPSADEPIKLCIEKPVACAPPLWPIRGAIVVALAGTAAYFGLGFIGNKLVDYGDYPDGAFIEGDGVSTIKTQIACALPRARERALVRYAADLHYQPQTEDVIERQIALAGMWRCENAVDLLHHLGRYERAVEVARDCGHPEYARSSLLALGEYARVADLPPVKDSYEPDEPLYGMIGSGRWLAAAAFVDKRAHRDDVEGDRCIAGYFRRLAGETDNATGTSEPCRVVFADYNGERTSTLELAEWAFADGRAGFVDFEHLALWLVPHTTADDYATHLFRSERALDLGQLDVAQTELDKAFALDPVDDQNRAWWTWRRRQITNDRALRAGTPIAPFDPTDPGPEVSLHEITHLDAAALMRSGAPAAKAWRAIRDMTVIAAAFDAAIAGDGLPLAQLFERSTELGGLRIRDEFLLAVAPRVTKHREELARVMRNRRLMDDRKISSLVHELAIRRDLLRQLGDKPGADRLQTIIDRHAKAFTEPQAIKALMLVQMR